MDGLRDWPPRKIIPLKSTFAPLSVCFLHFSRERPGVGGGGETTRVSGGDRRNQKRASVDPGGRRAQAGGRARGGQRRRASSVRPRPSTFWVPGGGGAHRPRGRPPRAHGSPKSGPHGHRVAWVGRLASQPCAQ